MPQRIPIRVKLLAALIIPIAALLVVAALEVVQSAKQADEVRDQTSLATAAIGPAGLINNVVNERNYGATDLLGATIERAPDLLDLPVDSYDEAAAATDESLASLRADVESRGGDVAEAYLPVLDELEEGLGPLREQVNGYEGPREVAYSIQTKPVQDLSDRVFNGYSELVTKLFETNTQVALTVDDPMLRRGAELNDMATRALDTVSQVTRLLLLASVSPAEDGGEANKLDTPQEVAQVSAAYGQVISFEETAAALGTGPYEEATQRMLRESRDTGFFDVTDKALQTSDVDTREVFRSVSMPADVSLYAYPADLKEIIDAQAEQLNDEASQRQQWYLALAALAVVVALVVTWLVSRSITQPLRSLTRQAKEMAEHRLPDAVLDILETPLGDNVEVPEIEPVSVTTRDEVADVADALNTVQDSALDLAVEQAVLRRNIADSFVNLGRRNQNLLGRQLDFITELESNETDPDTLASLFRLDHLATRMRRNAESLLVLAGIDPPRKWAAPVRLTDVIRAALGEVEDYQRVTVRGVEPATILGSAAADLAHLIAEFIENALTFSPPDQNVDIRGRNRPDGYTLAIIDSGLGMPAADIAQANRRLGGTESFTIAPSKYLGHYVAGNLAARHGIHLHLENSPGNGITATIDLPPTLLTTDAPVGDPITDPHGTRPVATPVGGAPAPATLAAGSAFEAGPGAPLPGGAPLMPAASGQGPADAPMAPVAPAARTASGLVKRSPRGNEAPAAHMPDDDLIATLSSYTSQRGPGDAVPGTGAVPPGPALPPPVQSIQSPGGPMARQQGAGLPGVAPLPRRPGAAPTGPGPGGPPPGGPGGPMPGGPSPGGPIPGGPSPGGPIPGGPIPGGPSPGGPIPGGPIPGGPSPGGPMPGGPGPGGPGLPGRHGPAGLRGLRPGGPGEPGPGAPAGPPPGPFPATGPQPVVRGPGGPGPGGPGPGGPGPGGPGPVPPSRPGDTWSGLAALTTGPRRAVGAGRPPRQPIPPAGPRPDPNTGGLTEGGLARRVRGAQLPTTQPLSLRRGGATAPPAAPQHAGGPEAGYGHADRNAAGNGSGDAANGGGGPAKDVYSFLSSFTAGVQRGLDEARRDTRNPEDEQ